MHFWMISFNKVITGFTKSGIRVFGVSGLEIIFKANIAHRRITERNLLILLRNKSIIAGADDVADGFVHFRYLHLTVRSLWRRGQAAKALATVADDGAALGGECVHNVPKRERKKATPYRAAL